MELLSPGSEGSVGARTFPWVWRPELAATRAKGAWHQGQGPGHLKRKWGLQGRRQYRPSSGRETRGIQHTITPQKGRGWVAVQGSGAILQAQGAVPPASWDPALRISRAGRKEGGVKPGGQAAGANRPHLCESGLADASGRGGGGAGPRREGVRGRRERLETRQRERKGRASSLWATHHSLLTPL